MSKFDEAQIKGVTLLVSLVGCRLRATRCYDDDVALILFFAKAGKKIFDRKTECLLPEHSMILQREGWKSIVQIRPLSFSYCLLLP